jgi:hypothetical protein
MTSNIDKKDDIIHYQDQQVFTSGKNLRTNIDKKEHDSPNEKLEKKDNTIRYLSERVLVSGKNLHARKVIRKGDIIYQMKVIKIFKDNDYNPINVKNKKDIINAVQLEDIIYVCDELLVNTIISDKIKSKIAECKNMNDFKNALINYVSDYDMDKKNINAEYRLVDDTLCLVANCKISRKSIIYIDDDLQYLIDCNTLNTSLSPISRLCNLIWLIYNCPSYPKIGVLFNIPLLYVPIEDMEVFTLSNNKIFAKLTSLDNKEVSRDDIMSNKKNVYRNVERIMLALGYTKKESTINIWIRELDSIRKKTKVHNSIFELYKKSLI